LTLHEGCEAGEGTPYLHRHDLYLAARIALHDEYQLFSAYL
jgi:hypothetical protein